MFQDVLKIQDHSSYQENLKVLKENKNFYVELPYFFPKEKEYPASDNLSSSHEIVH